MPSNLLRHDNSVWSGHTIDFKLRNMAAQYWNGTGTENYAVANLPLYVITLTEQGVVNGGASGSFTAMTPAGLPSGQWDGIVTVRASLTATVTNIAVTNNVATITTSAAHGFTNGRNVIVSGLTNTFLNGIWTLTSASGTSFGFAVTHANVGSTADSGTATSSAAAPAQTDLTLGTNPAAWYWDGTNWHMGPAYADALPSPVPPGYGSTPPAGTTAVTDLAGGSNRSPAIMTVTAGGAAFEGAIVQAYLTSAYSANPATAPVIASTTTDVSGHWTLNLPTGASYTLIFGYSGKFTSQGSLTV